MPTDQNIIKVNIDDIIISKFQPRKVFDEESIKELALSIKTYGILNPLLVRKKNDKYELIAGERRYRASKMLGLKQVPVIIKDLSDDGVREISLIENIQRNNLNPIEEAEAFKEILSSNSITQEELSLKIGKTQSSISNKMRLLNLSSEVKDAILNGKISERHGRTLLKLTEDEQNQILEEIINKKLSVKATEELINKKNSKENIKNVLNSIDLDNTSSNTFNDIEPEIKEKGEEKMNNNTGIGNFFPQMDNINPNINPEGGITFNNTPINGNVETSPISMNTTTVPLTSLNQEPAISTIPTETINTIEPTPVVSPTLDTNINVVNTVPTIEPVETIQEPQVEPTMTMPDPPLFTAPSPQPISSPEETNIPINNQTPIGTVEPTTIEKITNLLITLNDEKISYKEYSNDTENCIIISIKK